MTISSCAEAMKVVDDCDMRRVKAATNSNLNSSRSHSVITVTLNDGKKEIDLSIVDLAGSERIKKAKTSRSKKNSCTKRK